MKDKILEDLIKKEIKRQNKTLDLIASENVASTGILKVLGTSLVNKYSEGYPGKRYYPGNAYVDEIEELAKSRALKLFKLDPQSWSVNVQPYSGSPANFAIYAALAEPGEKIMGMALSSGGHLTHGHRASLTGKIWQSVQYGVNPKTGLVDYDKVLQLARKERPKIIVSGFTAYPRKVDFKKLGEIAKKTGAYHVADISHIAGLVAAGFHASPFPYADVVMTTTHKTLRGPRGAVIFAKRQETRNKKRVTIAEAIDKAVFPGLQGGPHDNVTAAKALMFFEDMQPSFKRYQAQVVKNAKALAEELKRLGFNLVSGGTDTHLVLVDLRNQNIDGMTAERKLETVGIIANRNSIPGDASPFKPSGLRLGTPSLTSRGMKEKEMREIANLIGVALISSSSVYIKKQVLGLCKKFSLGGKK